MNVFLHLRDSFRLSEMIPCYLMCEKNHKKDCYFRISYMVLYVLPQMSEILLYSIHKNSINLKFFTVMASENVI